jgi:hypothetical protein
MSEAEFDPSDPLYVRAPAASKAKRPAPKEVKSQNYLFADMDDVCRGLNAAGVVWVRLLQLRSMREHDKWHVLSNGWFERYGVDRHAKNRGLHNSEQDGAIRVVWSDRRSARVMIMPRPRRRRPKSG